MRADRIILAASALASGACFNPGDGSGDRTATDGQTTSSGGTATLTMSGPTSAGPGPGSNTGSSSTAPTTTSVDGSSTGPGADCANTSECNGDLLCIDATCQPCDQAGDPDQACSDEDPALPVCDADAGACAACVATTCDGDTPVCDPVAGCVACVEHSECPDSACHLLGSDQGGCFDEADVVEVSDITELVDALSIGSGAQRVINLSAETFSVAGGLSIVGEVAILGQPGSVITGGATNVMSLGAGGTQYLYLANLVVEDGPNRVVRCDAPGGLWLDDTVMQGYPTGVLSGCETHARRSRVTAIDGAGAAFDMMPQGDLIVENTAVGPDAPIAIRLIDASVDLRYVTVAGNAVAMDCTGTVGGEVRNSILVSNQTSSIMPGCNMGFVDNAVDGGFGFGQDVGAFDPTWFADSGAGDFHLTAAGEGVFEDIADWDDGDPVVDIDGDERPQDMPGFPGIDEVP